MLRTEVLSGVRLFAHLEKPWRALVAEGPNATPFQTWEWQSTWYRHYGHGKKPIAFALFEADDLVALMTFVKSTRAWRTLRSLGVGPSDYLHPLIRSGAEAQSEQALAEFLTTLKGVDLIDLQQVRETQTAFHGCGCLAPIEQASCLVLDLPSTYEEYLATLGKSLRYDVRKLDKTLFKGGRAVIEQVPQDRLQEGFDTFLAQHRARWRDRKLPGAFVGRSTAFHREWIENGAKRGWVDLKLLRLDGQVIGAIYAMSLGETVYYYQAGFDPGNSSVSPGSLLVADTIRTAIEEGRKHFDFMRGDEPYKRRWKPQRAWANRRYLIPCTVPLGEIGFGWNRLAGRIETAVRGRLESGVAIDGAG